MSEVAGAAARHEFMSVGGATAWVPDLAQEPPLSGLSTYWIETWGCQMNQHDSEMMAGVLRSFGLRAAPVEGEADIILLNTCSVREKAAQKVFTRLGQLKRHKRSRPHMVLGVCGCVAQQEQASIFARAPHVDLVMGPRRIGSLPDLIRESRIRRHALGVLDPRDRLFPEQGVSHRVSRTRAYVTVMEGCNKGCTFCIVPMTRGKEAYRPPGAILREVRDCVEGGLLEIELLGQNVNAWRHASTDSWDFTRLLGEVAQTSGVRRVRFTTSHPLHFKNSIIEAMASHEAICKHLHLPAQSGSDAVLRRMKRGYSVREYLDRIDQLRCQVSDVALSTDIIVGFPGETERDFQATLDLLDRVRYDTVFSFVYSPRLGTPAVDLADDTDPEIKMERLHRLQRLQDTIQAERNRAWEGRTVEVLVDGPASRPGRQVAGRTSQNHLVNFDGAPEMIGRFVNVQITRSGAHSLTGTLEPRPPLTSRPGENIDGCVNPL